ncbi:unnamed protein product [Caretta caretta]
MTLHDPTLISALCYLSSYDLIDLILTLIDTFMTPIACKDSTPSSGDCSILATHSLHMNGHRSEIENMGTELMEHGAKILKLT